MKQGDISWYTFRAPDKRRPVLILTRNSAISYLNSVTVAQITTTIRGVPSEVALTPLEDGVFEECVVNAYNLQTIQKNLVGELITHLSPERMREVRASIEFGRISGSDVTNRPGIGDCDEIEASRRESNERYEEKFENGSRHSPEAKGSAPQR